MVVAPSNSHPPVVTLTSDELNYIENTELALLNGVTLSDMDENCSPATITGARIQITTATADNDEEILEVCSECSNLSEEPFCFSSGWGC